MTNWYNITLGDTLDIAADKYSSHEAIVCTDTRVTYRQFQKNVNRFAKGLLRLGINKGDNVSLLMTNIPEWQYVRFAVAKIGAILVMINTRYKEYELDYLLRQSDSTTLILMDKYLKNNYIDMVFGLCPELASSNPGSLKSDKFSSLKNVICLSEKKYDGTFSFSEIMDLGADISDDKLERVQRSIDPNDVVNILYTSGTTAFPKGVMLTHNNIVKNEFYVGERQQFTVKDRLIFCPPLFTSYGSLNATFSAMTHGTCLVLPESFDPTVALQLIDKEKCTVIYGIDSIFEMLLSHPDLAKYNTKSLRTGLAGIFSGARPTLLDDIVNIIGVSKINTCYGLTEAAAVSTWTDLDDPIEIKRNTAGRALPEIEVGIKNPETGDALPPNNIGEICIRGFSVMKGYYKMEEETKKTIDKDGWLCTGDLGVIDESGYLIVKGRIKDMLKVGGFNVSSQEVEEFLLHHPKINACYVVGAPDKKMVEVPAAFVELKERVSASEEEIIGYCKDKMANFKIPKYVRFMKEFPRSSTFKVQKFRLREMIVEELKLEG